jgi:hypothetical protein
MAKDFKLDDNGDWAIENFGFAFTSDNVEYVKQKIKIRLQFFKGEYYLNTDTGVPYYQEILGKQITVDDAIAILKATIVGTPGVTELLNFEPNLDGATRILDIVFKVKTDNNEIIELTQEF